MSWVDDSVEAYYKWLKDRTFISADTSTGWSVISTPFIGLFNDTIEIYVRLDGDKIYLSDDGLTLHNLELIGVSIHRSPKRKDRLTNILLNYGIKLNDNELTTTASCNDFAQKKHNLICAISEISDMDITAKNVVASMFKEDVKELLIEQDIIYTPQFIAKGDTGIEFTFDFQIAGKNNEIVIKTFNTLNSMNVPNFLFGWEDIKYPREKISGKNIRGLAIVNNVDKDIKSEYIEALNSKGADCILWAERYNIVNLNKLHVA